jgi:POT family proton-dependent oligopeptide transporter
MSEAIDQPTQEVVEGVQDAGGLGGHPRGLTTLFFTELWERFSYYGMRAILVLYMVALPEQGGLGFDTKRAASIYGTYTMSVYLTALPGGLIADRWLGARLAVLLGGIVIACGHFTMVFQSTNFLYAGMALIAIGTGLLKPNISAMVGGLYRENDPRRDSGFSLFYMGINIGAVLAPLVCGYLAQSEGFKGFLAARGFNPATSWHWGFGAAGIGMTLGLVVFVLQGGRLRGAERKVEKRRARKSFRAATGNASGPSLSSSSSPSSSGPPTSRRGRASTSSPATSSTRRSSATRSLRAGSSR